MTKLDELIDVLWAHFKQSTPVQIADHFIQWAVTGKTRREQK